MECVWNVNIMYVIFFINIVYEMCVKYELRVIVGKKFLYAECVNNMCMQCVWNVNIIYMQTYGYCWKEICIHVNNICMQCVWNVSIIYAMSLNILYMNCVWYLNYGIAAMKIEFYGCEVCMKCGLLSFVCFWNYNWMKIESYGVWSVYEM